MRKCYISKNYKGINSAGNKAKTDIEASIQKIGFINIGNKQAQKTNLFADYFSTLFSVLKAVSNIKKGDVILLQYPWKKYYDFLCIKAHKKGAKTITLIHDLGSFRRQKLTIEQEVARLNQSDCIIAHNPSMKKWLEENGVKAPVTTLEIFDYLSKSNPTEEAVDSEIYRIAYAGALSSKKNQFLYDWFSKDLPFTMELFGNGFESDTETIKAKINYHGFTQSDTLISSVRAHFGLVWDGDSIDECSGTYGLYLRYNNPHKTSLYLRSHLPVIVWSQSALAPFVRENGAGICVDSLQELPQILQSLNKQDYQEMKSNAQRVGNQIAAGKYVQLALDRALTMI